MNKYIILVGLLCISNVYLSATDTLFTLLPPARSGITFRNDVIERQDLNIITEGQNYVYSGAGVAIGDIDKDGLPDIFFAGNMNSSKLYLNKGNMKFEDISVKANIFTNNWCTGVTMADVNGDGWLDIYVSSYGYPSIDKARCWLFINLKNGKFSEKAEAFGLLNKATNVSQSSFFDYDLDGDLDIYLAVYPNQYKDEINFDFEDRYPVKIGSDKLLENNQNKKFKDVSEQAGILKENAYGLSILTRDFNNDGLLDIYVGNDFAYNNFLYINQGNKTFKESVKEYFDHTSFYTMGMDIGDLSGDFNPEIMELDMSPESNQKYKTDFHEFTFDIYRRVVAKYMRQEVRNNLQFNNGNNTYSEIGQSAGVDLTDWSWTPLIKDFNLDGKNDIFISNGIKRDVLNSDFFFWKADSILRANGLAYKDDFKVRMLNEVPPMLLSNYFFVNEGNTRFQNKAKESGMGQLTASNGAAYADLDGDGDDDLVVNNMDDFAYIYQNNVDKKKPNYFSFLLQNEKGIPVDNVKYNLYAGGDTYYYEATNQRGFYSSSDKRFIVGIGEHQAVDSLRVTLMGNKYFTLVSPSIANPITYILDKNTKLLTSNKPAVKPIFSCASVEELKNFENQYIDFKYQPALMQMYSKMAPTLSVSHSTENEKPVWLYYGTSKGNDKYLCRLKSDFTIENKVIFEAEKKRENTGSLFFDANNDGKDDLLVLSGSGEWDEPLDNIGANLYLCQGDINFKQDTFFPKINLHLMKVLVFDFDNDNDTDIVLFPYVSPQTFPKGSQPVFLTNEKGKFKVTDNISSSIEGNYMDAINIDWNGDGQLDILTVGHWMAPEIWLNEKGYFSKRVISENLKGLWNTVSKFDIDNDGFEEIFLGNIGTNLRYNLTGEDSLVVWDKDFNNDGVKDPFICTAEKGKFYPIYLHSDITRNYPFTKKNILHQFDYAYSDMSKIFPAIDFSHTPKYICNFEKSVMLKIGKNIEPTVVVLPEKMQEAPINNFSFLKNGDLNGILVFGQNRAMRDEIGPMDANRGQYYEYTSSKTWEFIPQTSINIQREIKTTIPLDSKHLLILTKEGSPVIVNLLNKTNPSK